MKKYDIPSLLRLLLAPAGLILLGLLLLFHPDSASVLLAKILGWTLMVLGGGFIVAALVDRLDIVGKVLGAVVCLCAGLYLVRNPLALAAGIGRFVGILLVIWGIRELIDAWKDKTGLVFPIIGTVFGVILIVLPMTTSRLVWTLCGIAVLLIGAAMLVDRLRVYKRLKGPDDPNIIDAL